jgi:hypothetical protein
MKAAPYFFGVMSCFGAHEADDLLEDVAARFSIHRATVIEHAGEAA